MNFHKKRTFFFILVLSCLWNFFCLLVLDFAVKMKGPTTPKERFTQIEFERIEKDKLKYRTVGIKDGEKEFKTEVPVPTPSQLRMGNEVRPESSKEKTAASTLKLNDLKPSISPTSESSFLITKASEKNLNLKRQKVDFDMSKRLLKEMVFEERESRALQMASPTLTFNPPEGVKEDELNSMEKIFFSFQKRTYLSYVNSFIKSYNEIALTRPRLESLFSQTNETMLGRVVYDREGNIVSIKILQWSLNDDLEKLFEKTLENIKALPNPPKALLDSSGQITIYYQLRFSG